MAKQPKLQDSVEVLLNEINNLKEVWEQADKRLNKTLIKYENLEFKIDLEPFNELIRKMNEQLKVIEKENTGFLAQQKAISENHYSKLKKITVQTEKQLQYFYGFIFIVFLVLFSAGFYANGQRAAKNKAVNELRFHKNKASYLDGFIYEKKMREQYKEWLKNELNNN